MKQYRPSIFIYTCYANQNLVKEICAGIEEEGVLYTVFDKQSVMNVDELAFDAANESTLSVGIGVFKETIAVQVRLLEKGQNLFLYEDAKATSARMAGSNSARVIKRIPFKL